MVDHHHILTPLNRRKFFNKTFCEWTIRTNRSEEIIALMVYAAYDIEEENDVATLASKVDVRTGNNLSEITFQVSMAKPHYCTIINKKLDFLAITTAKTNNLICDFEQNLYAFSLGIGSCAISNVKMLNKKIPFKNIMIT